MKIIIKNYHYRDNDYVVIYDGEFYMTIDRRFIDEHGNTTKELYYNDGLHTHETLAGCIEATKHDLDMKHYMNNGMSEAVAFCTVFDCMEELEEVKKVLRG